MMMTKFVECIFQCKSELCIKKFKQTVNHTIKKHKQQQMDDTDTTCVEERCHSYFKRKGKMKYRPLFKKPAFLL